MRDGAFQKHVLLDHTYAGFNPSSGGRRETCVNIEDTTICLKTNHRAVTMPIF
jgi:hypothetical protein